MARRSDPAVTVVRFFETAPIDVASTVLALVKEAVQRRGGGPRRRATPGVPLGIAATAVEPTAVASANPRRRRLTPQVPEAGTGAVMPPLPGPVASVGE